MGNKFNYDNFKLVFDPALDYALFSYTAKVNDVACFRLGLDGVYRFSETEIGPFAAYGDWTAADTFEITYRQIGYSTEGKFTLIFDEELQPRGRHRAVIKLDCFDLGLRLHIQQKPPHGTARQTVKVGSLRLEDMSRLLGDQLGASAIS